jgi:hypothetical protein
MIYVLLLEKNKIYVGYSARPIGERFLEHFHHCGSKWTQLYRPLQVLQVQEGGEEEENELTLEMMETFGWWNVRGGKWCQVEMNSCPAALMERQRLELPVSLNQKSKCTRCGRTTHTSPHCDAKITTSGEFIIDSSSDCVSIEIMDIDSSDCGQSECSSNPKLRGACFRCGRDSHWVRDCFAITDVYGNSL